MLDSEKEVNLFIADQTKTASGRRLENLQKDLVGERKLLHEVIWPVFQSFDGFTLEHEVKSLSGMNIYVDVFYHPLRLAFESEGFVPHAENITRDRFSFERMRVRTLTLCGYKYIPFTWDELNKRPDICQRNVYEILGRFSGVDDQAMQKLTVYEREVIRRALHLNRPFRLVDACDCLQLGVDTGRKVLKQLLGKKLIRPVGEGRKKIRLYELDERANDYML